MKICTACKQDLPKEDFEITSNPKGKYFRSVCKSCRTKIANRKKSSSPEKYLRHLYTQAKSARRNSGIEWNIEAIDIIALWHEQEGKCALSGVFMTWQKDGGGRKELNASIDRIDPHNGYLPNNVQLVCSRVNILKHNLTEDELYWWCKNIITLKELN